MNLYIKNKAKMCDAAGKKRMRDALRACDLCSTNEEERSSCYKEVAKDTGLRTKTCMMM